MLSLSCSYLNIVPSHLLSAQEVTGDSGITYYMIEAHQLVILCNNDNMTIPLSLSLSFSFRFLRVIN